MTKLVLENKNSFIPKERGSLPRILLIDFKEEYKKYLEDENYSIFSTYSGLSDNKELSIIPKHDSEIEIILWDMSNLREDDNILLKEGAFSVSSGANAIYQNLIDRFATYFNRIRKKGGFVGVFLGDKILPPMDALSNMIGYNFLFLNRDTSTMVLNKHKEDDSWYEFYNRFIKEENIKFSINWNDNQVSFNPYFKDEDNNFFAINHEYFAIIPKIEENKKKKALIFLLQNVLPYFCRGKMIFPDKYYYLWANKDIYLPLKVQELKEKKKKIIEDNKEKIDLIDQNIKKEMDESEYLSNMLITDDSSLFSDDKKLSNCVHTVLEDDLGFSVTDVDKLRLKAGKSLKEDKWIKDKDFFALVEIKGSDKGSKANWVKKDFSVHINEFKILKEIKDLNAILIFNHERWKEPENRSEPFAGDSELITSCKKSNVCLLPVYELFKLVKDIKRGVVSAEKARENIKNCKGLFKYDLK